MVSDLVVTEIGIEMVVDGARKTMVYRTPDKIAALLADPGTLGEFLCNLRDHIHQEATAMKRTMKRSES